MFFDSPARGRYTTNIMRRSPTIYIETSIISYLAAKPSSDLMTAACQQITAKWWEGYRRLYKIVTSALVVTESHEGDPQYEE